MSDLELREIVETGDIKWQGDRHLWIFKVFPNRNDNMVCAAAVEEEVLVIKTVMTNWEDLKR
ncbi:MAG: DUF4258 domain-containing protein [Magnetococcales bacterium]|nr:DUF4258 domain-containing protein [Magnetococcales bacterium]